MKLYPLERTSLSWIQGQGCQISQSPEDADFIIYESVGDDHGKISMVKNKFSYCKEKLVFILSGDVNFSDDQSVWFATTIVPDNVRKFQLYTTNPRIHKFKSGDVTSKSTFGYFGGTIWDTPERRFMRNLNSDKWKIQECKNYWGESVEMKEEISLNSYNEMVKSHYTLCPKGKGASSMRVAESLACGSIPILINDKSNPFFENYGDLALRLHSTDEKVISEFLNELPIPESGKAEECVDFYNSNINKFGHYTWSVCSGFSNKIIEKLEGIKL